MSLRESKDSWTAELQYAASGLDLQGVEKNSEKYAKYHISVNIAKYKEYGLLYMAFCHILTKFCVNIFTSF